MEAILRAFLRSHLSSYISSSEDEGSGLSFKGVEFKADEYPRVERFTARSLEILVPWSALARQSIEVHLTGVDLTLGAPISANDGETDAEGEPSTIGDDLGASTRGRPWDEGELFESNEWLAEESQTEANQNEGGSASWVGMSIRSRLIRSGLNLSLFIEDLTFTENLGTLEATVSVDSLSVENIPLEDWKGLVRNPDGWLGKAVALEQVRISVGQNRLHVGSMHLSSVLPLYEFLAEEFDYNCEGDRVVPVLASVSTLALEGPQIGTISGWIMGKMAGEEKENGWAVDLGVTVGEITYQELALTRVVVLLREGRTSLKAERLGINLGISWGLFVAEDVVMQVEHGMAQIDNLVMTGSGASLAVSGVEVDWKDGVRLRTKSISCTVIVEDVMGCSSEHVCVGKRDSEVDSKRPSDSGGSSIGSVSIKVDLIVLGLQTIDGALNVWSSGVMYDEGRLVVECAGVDVDCERLVGIHGPIEVVSDGVQRVIKFGDVNIWLAREYLQPIVHCREKWSGLNLGQGQPRDDCPPPEQGAASRVEPTNSEINLEFRSLAVHLAEKDGKWLREITVVDTRTGDKRTIMEGDEFLESIELDDGYSLYEDQNQQGMWYIARPVSFRSLLRKAVKVDGCGVSRGEVVQLYVGPGGGRLCEVDVEGRKIILGVPGRGGAPEDAEGIDWDVDVLVASPGSTASVNLGDFSCLLCSSLSTYNRLDIVLAPRVLFRNELPFACRVEVTGEQSGEIAMVEGEEIGINLDAISGSRFTIVIPNNGMEYRSLPLSFTSVGSRVLTMRSRSPVTTDIDITTTKTVAVAIDDGDGYVCISIRYHMIENKGNVESDTRMLSPEYIASEEANLQLSVAGGIAMKDRNLGVMVHNRMALTQELRSSARKAPNSGDSDRGHSLHLLIEDQLDTTWPDGCHANTTDEKTHRIVEELTCHDSEPEATPRRSSEPFDLLEVFSNRMGATAGYTSSNIDPKLDNDGELGGKEPRHASEGLLRSPNTKPVLSRLEGFLRDNDRFSSVFVLQRLTLGWGSDRLGQETSIKFASFRTFAGREQALCSIESDSAISYRAHHCRLEGFSSVTFDLIDDHGLEYLTTIRDLFVLLTADEERMDRGSDDRTDERLLVSLSDHVHLSCLGVALPVLTLPSIRLKITPIEAATVTELSEHVRKCGIRTLPTLLLDIIKAWL